MSDEKQKIATWEGDFVISSLSLSLFITDGLCVFSILVLSLIANNPSVFISLLQMLKKKKKKEANLAIAIAIAMEVSSDHSLSLKPNPDEDDNLSAQLTPEATSKKRKVLQKTVVSVKIGSRKAAIGIGKMKNEGPPPDFWSWRKYGQKPIKGSPYPRGYYRCSTTKGCSAKKQVERCKTDGSMFIITYTSSHNHPGPNISTLHLDQTQEEIQPQPLDQDQDQNNLHPNQGLEKQDQDKNDEKNSIIPSDDDEEEEEEIEEEEEEEEIEEKKAMECLEEAKVSSCSHELINLSATNKSEMENHDHFFDELEELPIPPPFSSLMRSSCYFFDEVIRIPAAPS